MPNQLSLTLRVDSVAPRNDVVSSARTNDRLGGNFAVKEASSFGSALLPKIFFLSEEASHDSSGVVVVVKLLVVVVSPQLPMSLS
jgi:hypothetical protein